MFRSKVLAAALALTGASATAPLTSVDGALFFEGFDKDWESRWVVSKNADFTGTWKHEEYASPAGIEGDKGLEVGDEAKKHAVSTVFEKAVDPKGTGVVVQYELQMKNRLECGGAYLKLLSASDKLTTEGFSGESPYTIMFGPDKCGSTNKVHFIMRHKSPVTGEWEEKHIASAPTPKLDVGETHLYTAVVGADNTVKILIDNEEVTSADLMSDSDFTPAVNPPTEIDDPDDTKPEDWVDAAQMADPDASKPDDWNEEAPAMITDPEETKPTGWLDDVDPEVQVPDASATAPDDWDAEEDGEWEAPMVPNPACEQPNPGCGEWAAQEISNPEYKGTWYAPQIDNPEYKGVWAPKQIANPNFFKDEAPHAMAPIGGIGIELWTMQAGALFDNILVAADPAVAAKAAENFAAKTAGEKAAKEKIQEEKDAEALKNVEEKEAEDGDEDEEEEKDEL